MLKNSQNTLYLRFSFIPKTGIVCPKTRFSFYCGPQPARRLSRTSSFQKKTLERWAKNACCIKAQNKERWTFPRYERSNASFSRSGKLYRRYMGRVLNVFTWRTPVASSWTNYDIGESEFMFVEKSIPTATFLYRPSLSLTSQTFLIALSRFDRWDFFLDAPFIDSSSGSSTYRGTRQFDLIPKAYYCRREVSDIRINDSQ